MKTLVVLNCAAPFLVAVLIALPVRRDWSQVHLITGFALAIAILVLGIVSLVAPVRLWRTRGWRALIVPGSLIAAALLVFAVSPLVTKLARIGTPAWPETFLRGSRHANLEAIALRLLANGPTAESHPDDSESLDALDLRVTQIDHHQRVVTFHSVWDHTWYYYIFTPDSLPDPFMHAPILTPEDVQNWGVLRDIAHQEVAGIGRDSDGSVFQPFVVAQLRGWLGEAAMERLRTVPPPAITTEEKAVVLARLNEQLRVGSRLIERPEVTWEGTPPQLRISAEPGSVRPWVHGLLEYLLEQRRVEMAADGRHLRLRDGLSPFEAVLMEWVHVGLMNALYGALLEKRELEYDRRLRPHWYLRVSQC